jgi:hypothetical protein
VLDKHLTNLKTYVQVSEEDAQLAASNLYTKIYQCTCKDGMHDRLTKDAVNYICHNTMKNRSNLFGYFYLTIKIHKTPVSTRLVCSDCASLIHPLGKWLDLVLQPVIASQPLYFMDSFTLKQELDKLVLPPNASIITFDAVSMYTNIDIDDSISRISSYLKELWDEYECKAIVDAMEIVMKNNCM